ncbi:FKBP-type peptidyl-prolyl cis-trans isomerase [Dactylosporangium sp. NPDC051541]|uniref:FKBP-type peptidyl-prolyl cis-trans isomerase n=1 Tax=Dactylosporangium sp. NPDC051541 TaxID=3363977 RepID=UPI0037945F4D
MSDVSASSADVSAASEDVDGDAVADSDAAAADADADAAAEPAPAARKSRSARKPAGPAKPVTAAKTETDADAEADADADAKADADADLDADASDPDASDPDDGDEPGEGDDDDADKPAEKKVKSKGPAPLTKAEKRAAARVAAHRAARRKRVGQAIAGTVIVLLAIGGAFAGVWYFGDRAEQQKTECKKADQSSYPPLLGGFDKRLAEEPKTEAGKEQSVPVRQVTTLIQGKCKTVKAGDTVVVNYIGLTYKDGKKFDSSWDHKQTFPVPVGMLEEKQQAQVIEGWDRGLVGLKVGSRVILDIPVKEAYNNAEGYPQGDLRFYVDILDIQDPNASGGLQVPGN